MASRTSQNLLLPASDPTHTHSHIHFYPPNQFASYSTHGIVQSSTTKMSMSDKEITTITTDSMSVGTRDGTANYTSVNITKAAITANEIEAQLQKNAGYLMPAWDRVRAAESALDKHETASPPPSATGIQMHDWEDKRIRLVKRLDGLRQYRDSLGTQRANLLKKLEKLTGDHRVGRWVDSVPREKSPAGTETARGGTTVKGEKTKKSGPSTKGEPAWRVKTATPRKGPTHVGSSNTHRRALHSMQSATSSSRLEDNTQHGLNLAGAKEPGPLIARPNYDGQFESTGAYLASDVARIAREASAMSPRKQFATHHRVQAPGPASTMMPYEREFHVASGNTNMHGRAEMPAGYGYESPNADWRGSSASGDVQLW